MIYYQNRHDFFCVLFVAIKIWQRIFICSLLYHLILNSTTHVLNHSSFILGVKLQFRSIFFLFKYNSRCVYVYILYVCLVVFILLLHKFAMHKMPLLIMKRIDANILCAYFSYILMLRVMKNSGSRVSSLIFLDLFQPVKYHTLKNTHAPQFIFLKFCFFFKWRPK